METKESVLEKLNQHLDEINKNLDKAEYVLNHLDDRLAFFKCSTLDFPDGLQYLIKLEGTVYTIMLYALMLNYTSTNEIMPKCILNLYEAVYYTGVSSCIEDSIADGIVYPGDIKMLKLLEADLESIYQRAVCRYTELANEQYPELKKNEEVIPKHCPWTAVDLCYMLDHEDIHGVTVPYLPVTDDMINNGVYLQPYYPVCKYAGHPSLDDIILGRTCAECPYDHADCVNRYKALVEQTNKELEEKRNVARAYLEGSELPIERRLQT